MIAEDDDTKVPVVAVVGFLPASKEGNLLKHILTGEHGKRVAVVRYADCLGVDGAELERCKCSQCVVDGVDLVETANGCAVACCRRHGDLAAALKKLKARQGCHLFSRLDKIIIEGADACDAADVHVAFLDQEVASFARLDAIVSCCVEIKILRRVRAESSRRPPRHRRDACSMAWRCRFLAARPSTRRTG